MKNDYASIATVEVQETVGSVDQIYKKVTAELQEFAGAPLINGKIDEVIIVFCVQLHGGDYSHNFGNCR